jgi:hypothetical protein
MEVFQVATLLSMVNSASSQSGRAEADRVRAFCAREAEGWAAFFNKTRPVATARGSATKHGLSAGGSDMRTTLLYKNSIPFVATMFAFLLAVTSAFAQTSGFTYQGRLTDGGAAANGNYDLQFALFDSLSGGTQVGSTQTVSALAVSNGVFTVTLDFGAASFSGANRFLDVSARPSGAGSFIPLTPRQQVTSTPYAVHSASSANADTATTAANATTATNATQLGGIAASQYIQTNDSRLSDARPPTAGSSNYIQTNPNSAQNANFNISGNGTVGGTLTGSVVNVTTQFNIGGDRVLSTDSNSNIFAGVSAGANTTGGHNSFLGSLAGFKNQTGGANAFVGYGAGNTNTSGSDNTFLGSLAGFNSTMGFGNTFLGAETGTNNTTGGFNAFLGFQAGFNNATGSNNTMLGYFANVGADNLTNATAIGSNAQVTQSNSLVLGSINGVHGATADTNVGIGTTAPLRTFQLGADFNALFTFSPSDGTPNAGYIRFGDKTGWKLHFARNRESSGGALNNGTTGVLMTIQDNGNVGIGTTVPDSLLSVNGNASKVGGGSWATFSDERLKNLKGRFTPGLKAVMKLQPLRYEYKRDNALNLKSEGEHIGFSAQAVQRIIPEAVTRDDKGYLLVNNDPILWTMLNAIKEQQAQIQTQQKQLLEQQNQLDALRKLACRSHRRVSVCK